MPRASYDRKRPGYRVYVHLLWRGLWPLLEAAAPEAERRRASALVAPDLSAQHRPRLLALLAEYRDALKADLGLARLPPTLPSEIVALGAEIPAPMLVRSSALFRFATRPRGRAKAQPRSKPPKPDQRDVTAWMLA